MNDAPATPVLDPITVEVIGAALSSIVEETGEALIRASYSTNIKERRDCSTALFHPDGRMVAQSESIPVHLGAMPEAVAAVMAQGPELGEIFVVNDPYTGGTHLPDITLVSRTELGYAVSRAHHADVGGMEPASLPSQSRELYQEGLILPPVRLVPEVLTVMLANMRNPDERRGDLRAQIASHHLAETRVKELVARRGADTVLAAMDELYAYSERRIRAGIAALPDGRYEASDVLEPVEGTLEIHVAVTIKGDEIEIDFAGTSPQYDGNLNCPLAVCRSACFFVVRCLTDPDVPASGGAFAPVTVRAPVGSLVNARPPAAVVAGNTETSNRVTDTLFSAFAKALPGRVPAMGQGTMNNITFGNRRFTYYETLGGGQGAGPGYDGPSAVHVTMSNTLNTPVEAFELAYPMRIERYGLLPGTGGAGRWRGGDGVEREIRVLEDCRFSVLAERRVHAPQGAEGGADGAKGKTLVNGEPQPSKATVALKAGDVVRVETPGGGGFGQA